MILFAVILLAVVAASVGIVIWTAKTAETSFDGTDDRLDTERQILRRRPS